MLSYKLRYLFSYHSLLLEINPNSGHETRVKSAIGILIEEARFAYPRVSKRQKLYEIIVIHFAEDPQHKDLVNPIS